MFEAVQAQNLTQIRNLVREAGFDLNSEIGPIPEQITGCGKDQLKKNNFKHTALTWTCWQGHLNFAKQLQDEGAEADWLTSDDLCVLNFAAMKDSTLHVLQHFVETYSFEEKGVNFCGKWKQISALISASACGAIECCRYLLENGAEVNHQDWKGLSALHHATIGGHFNIVKVLVDNGAAVYLRDNDMRNVVHHLVINHQSFRKGLLNKFLQYFIEERGLDVNTKTDNGTTALHEACSLGLVDVAKYLIAHKADLEAKKKGWETPSWSLVMGKCPKKNVKSMVMLMMEMGANLETKNCLGMTMTEYASKISDNKTMVDSLEDAQRLLRMKRMKALSARRKQILTCSSLPNIESENCGSRFMQAAPSSGVSTRPTETKESRNDNENADLEPATDFVSTATSIDPQHLLSDDSNSSRSNCSDIGSISDSSSDSDSEDDGEKCQNEDFGGAVSCNEPRLIPASSLSDKKDGDKSRSDYIEDDVEVVELGPYKALVKRVSAADFVSDISESEDDDDEVEDPKPIIPVVLSDDSESDEDHDEVVEERIVITDAGRSHDSISKPTLEDVTSESDGEDETNPAGVDEVSDDSDEDVESKPTLLEVLRDDDDEDVQTKPKRPPVIVYGKSVGNDSKRNPKAMDLKGDDDEVRSNKRKYKPTTYNSDENREPELKRSRQPRYTADDDVVGRLQSETLNRQNDYEDISSATDSEIEEVGRVERNNNLDVDLDEGLRLLRSTKRSYDRFPPPIGAQQQQPPKRRRPAVEYVELSDSD